MEKFKYGIWKNLSVRQERYWCAYCGEPLEPEDDMLKSWRFRSPKGGLTFIARIYRCHRCGRKIRVVERVAASK